MQTQWTCQHCQSVLQTSSYYKHLYQCHNLHLAECKECCKKLLTEPEINRHNQLGHQVTILLTVKERKRKLKELGAIEQPTQTSQAQAPISELPSSHRLEADNLTSSITSFTSSTNHLEDHHHNENSIKSFENEDTYIDLRVKYAQILKELEEAKATIERLKPSVAEAYKYEKLRWIANSNESVVYKADCREILTGKLFKVCIKDYKNVASYKPEQIAQCWLAAKTDRIRKQYTQIGAQIVSPNAVVFEWYDATMDDFNKRRSKYLLPALLKQALLQSAQALADLHKHNVLHLDVKPQNFFVKYKGDRLEVVIGDFGLSQIIHPLQPIVKPTGGTSFYKAPELDQSQASAASDVYSFGIMVYLMIHDNIKIPNDLSKQNITAHEFRKNELARQRQDKVPLQCFGLTQQAIQPEWYHIATESLKGLITSMLKADPLQRPTMAEVVQQLSQSFNVY